VTRRIDATTTIQVPNTTSSRTLVVVADGLVKTWPLVDGESQVTIGRSEQLEFAIDEASLSRRHAVLHIGDTLMIEDLGSANGTYVRGVRLAPGESQVIALNEAIELGNVTLIVQQRTLARPPRRLWGHDYFAARVDDECARGLRAPVHFGVIRVVAGGGAMEVPEALGNLLQPGDVIGSHAPGDYELLMLDALPDRIAAVAAQMKAAVEELGHAAKVGTACFPGDGREAEQLIAAAGPEPSRRSEPRPTVPDIQPTTMQGLYRLIERVAPGMISVLILGETGAGKEVTAEQIHRKSPRAARPFLRLNCAALSETLLESELFGHERGAFTGAMQTKPGLLEVADGGTVFLDEIGELPLSVQVKLLRVLEERTLLRVGGVAPKKIDVRFIAATNRDLEQEVEHGRFREDLYYRLNGVTLVVPPLRERVNEIAGLAEALLAQLAKRDELPAPPTIDPRALELLKGYSWPGNVRELRNVLERAALTSGGGTIHVDHLPISKMRSTMLGTRARPRPRPADDAPTPRDVDVRDLREPAEFVPRPLPDPRPQIQAALDQARGNQTKAAQILGVSRRTLVNWLRRYNFPRPRINRP
jgi:DNA-binding NtrC family response regulator